MWTLFAHVPEEYSADRSSLVVRAVVREFQGLPAAEATASNKHVDSKKKEKKKKRSKKQYQKYRPGKSFYLALRHRF